MVGVSADMAVIIGGAVGDVSASAVLWGAASAGENTIVTAVTEPGVDLLEAAGDGFISGAAGGAIGGVFGKAFELANGGGAARGLIADSESVAAPLNDADLAALVDYKGCGYWSLNPTRSASGSRQAPPAFVRSR